MTHSLNQTLITIRTKEQVELTFFTQKISTYFFL